MRRIYQTSQHCHTDAVELRTAAHGRLQVDSVVILTTRSSAIAEGPRDAP